MIGAWFAPNIEKAWKSFWAQPMILLRDEFPPDPRHVEVSSVLLRDVGLVETRFDPFGDTFNLGAR